MRRLRAWCLRFAAMFHKEQRDRELAEELESHLQMHIEDSLSSGMKPEEARRQALIKLGGVEQTKEKYRDRRGILWLETLLQDFRLGLRMLQRNLGFVCVCVVALALGIGISTTLFSVLYAVVLKPLPFPEQSRIVVGWKADPARGINLVELSYLDYKDMRDQSASFDDIAAMPTTTNGYSYIMTGKGEPTQVESSRVTANYFSVLGVTPYLGRAFRPEEDRVGANPVVILTFRFWQTQFGADPNIIGSSVALSGAAFTIIGVLPQEFVFPQGVDVFTPLATNRVWVENRGAVFLQIVGRLKPGFSLKTANSELNTIVARIAAQNPETKSEGQIAVIGTLPDYITGTNRTLIYLLFAGSMILLLVASINLASLLATRAVGRGGEIAIRVALGAGKKRLFQQFLAEGLILSGIGTVAGVAVSFPLIRLVAYFAPQEIPRIASVSVNAWAISFTVACLILTALLFGLTPLLLVRGPSLQTILRGSSGNIAGSRHHSRLGRVFLMAEISATLALVILAGTVAKSFRNLQNVKLGYDADRVFTCAVFLNPNNYQDPPARRRFFQDLVHRLQDRPEVIAAGAVLLRPLEGLVGWYTDYSLPGQTADEARKNPRDNFEVVTPTYFQAIGTPLLAGRTFEEDEDESKPSVAVVSESVARTMYGTPSRALGQHFKLGGPSDLTIVGIVGDARYRQLNQVSGDIFISYRQSRIRLGYVIVRTRNNPEAIGSVVRHEISLIDASQADGKEMTLRELVNVALARDRLHSLVLLLFGVGALLLTAVGVYGVVSDLVVAQKKDFGVRIALGARPVTIIGHLLRFILNGVLLGEIVGVFAATLATTAIRTTFFEVSPIDVISICSGCIVLVAVTLIACLPPALSAANADPMVALRHE